MRINEIIDESLLDEGPNDPHIFKAIYLIGGPGSGKSHVGKQLIQGTGIKYVNLDTFFELFAKKADASPTDLLVDEPEALKRSGEIAGRTQSLYASQRLGMIIDGTGRKLERIFASKKVLESLGYSTMAIFVNTSTETAQRRNAQRDRSVNQEFLAQAHRDVRANLGTIQNEFDTMVIIDNNDDQVDFDIYWKKVQKFINAPLTHRAQQWVERN